MKGLNKIIYKTGLFVVKFFVRVGNLRRFDTYYLLIFRTLQATQSWAGDKDANGGPYVLYGFKNKHTFSNYIKQHIGILTEDYRKSTSF